MAWLDLHAEILDEFEDAHRWVDYGLRAVRAQSIATAKRAVWIAEQCERARRQRRATRTMKLATRPPCPHCGGPVTRDAKGDRTRGAKVPTYCSNKCTRAAVWKRYVAKNGDPRNRRPGAHAAAEAVRREKMRTDPEYAARARALAAKRAKACRARKKALHCAAEAA